MKKTAKWHEWPQEKPTRTGEYLCRGIGGLNKKIHHWVCFWVSENECSDHYICGKFFYGGNEFNECPSGMFQWLDLKEL